uniref:Glycosyltransferase n=1 Tax=Davidia involucrata TaxID=16924 RepID=A0A5B6Z6M1_DAVIN
MNNHHFLLVSLAAQGHINPTLHLAKLLIQAGARVTFATTVHGLHRLTKTLPTLDGLSFASFSDGDDDGTKHAGYTDNVMVELKRVGSQTLTNLLVTLSDERRPVTFLIYNLLLPWAADVARDMHVPSAFLCSQSATTFAIYHRFFNRHDGFYDGSIANIDPSISVKLPGLPLLTCNDLPSFLLPTSPHASVIHTFEEHIETLEKDPNPCVLVNTFDALEEDSIRAIDNMKVIAIGPLIPSDTSFGCDLFDRSKDYIQWLDSKPECSVVYVSFGSLAVLQTRQMEELSKGLIESGRPFLWVVRSPDYEREDVKGMIENLLSEEGLIVPWCSQVEVLSHRSTGCFVTHCGWNSTVESLVAGMPVVGCPQFSDQMTNVKMVEEVWGNGVRALGNEEGVVEREEIRRCLDVVMGGGEIRRNAMKWKCLAMEAVKDGGSLHNNLKQFLGSLG